MITRVTSTQLLTDSSRTLQAAMARLSTLQTQASTGLRISVPSDDPAGTGASIQVRGQQANNAQYQRNATDGLGWLSVTDSALTQATSILQSARNLVLQASNAGSMSTTSRDAIAAQMQGLRDDLLATANTRYNGRSVFAGTSDADAFSAADMEFHIRIAKILDNPIFVAVSEAMLAWLKEYHTEMLIWTGKEKYTLAEHEEILERLAANDADGAEAAVLKHLERSRSLYVK